MKRIMTLVLGVCCLGLLTPGLASAKGHKGGKVTKEERQAAKSILKKYDANGNGKLDSDEVATLQKDYAAGNESDAKVFDVNNDNQLDDTEIATLQKCLPQKHKKKKADAGTAGDSN